MDTRGLSPFVEQGRVQHRHRRFTSYGVALSVLLILALIGLAAVLLLILGIAHVADVTAHFRVH